MSEAMRRAWIGNTVRIVEHDDATREPKQDGKILFAQVTEDTGSMYAHVRYDAAAAAWAGRETDVFYQESGWRAWDGEFRWRLFVAFEIPEPDDITCGQADEEATS